MNAGRIVINKGLSYVNDSAVDRESVHVQYRGTSLMIKRFPLGPYSAPMLGDLWWSQGVGRFLMGEVPLKCTKSRLNFWNASGGAIAFSARQDPSAWALYRGTSPIKERQPP